MSGYMVVMKKICPIILLIHDPHPVQPIRLEFFQT